MTRDTMESILAQLAIGTLNNIGWISDGSSAKAYEGVLLDVTSGKRGLRLTILVNRATGRTVTVTWRMSQSDAEQIVRGYDATRIDHQWGESPEMVLTVRAWAVRTYLLQDCWIATVYGFACQLNAI